MGSFAAVALALLAATPALAVHLGWLHLSVELATLCFGLAIVGASFATEADGVTGLVSAVC